MATFIWYLYIFILGFENVNTLNFVYRIQVRLNSVNLNLYWNCIFIWQKDVKCTKEKTVLKNFKKVQFKIQKLAKSWILTWISAKIQCIDIFNKMARNESKSKIIMINSIFKTALNMEDKIQSAEISKTKYQNGNILVNICV